MNKVMRYPIIKPIDYPWGEFAKTLRGIQKQTRLFMNKATQTLYEWQQYSVQYKGEHGEYPNVFDRFGYKAISGHIYDKLKGEANIVNSGNLATSLQRVDKKFKSDSLKILKGEMSLPSYKADVPVDLHNKSISIEKDGSGYIAELSLLSRRGKEILGTETIRYRCVIGVKGGTQKIIIDKCISGEYKVSASQIINKGNKWFLNLSYAFEPEKRSLNPEYIMGVDLGVTNAAYIGFNFDKYKRECISGDDVIRYKMRTDKKLSQDKKKRRYCGEGSIGHGRNTRMDVYNKYSDKVKDYTNTINHGWSKFIVDTAIKNNCGVIQMEDLSSINKKNKFIRYWTYYDLQEKIQYKAKEKGIKVVKIRPQYTSQRCSECGYIHAENRPEQKTFICQQCGFEANADFNAARNISMKDIDRIIEETLKRMEGERKCS